MDHVRARSGVDLVLSGGRIWCGRHTGFVDALAVAGDRVAAAGPREMVERLAGAATRRIDLAGRLAIPAFNEAHMHLLPYGLGLSQVNLRAEEVLSARADLTIRGGTVIFDRHGELSAAAAP
jgi:predicted amidohydrolase YtcJ